MTVLVLCDGGDIYLIYLSVLCNVSFPVAGNPRKTNNVWIRKALFVCRFVGLGVYVCLCVGVCRWVGVFVCLLAKMCS